MLVSDRMRMTGSGGYDPQVQAQVQAQVQVQIFPWPQVTDFVTVQPCSILNDNIQVGTPTQHRTHLPIVFCPPDFQPSGLSCPALVS